MSTYNLQQRLAGISKCSINGKKVTDLYKLLVNKPEIWELAYANICSNKGATTKGVDEVTADGQSYDRNREIMNQLRNGTYRPKPTRRVYIPKSNGKKRPLGIPTFTDKLVQEACRIILEAIYEPIFSRFSFGFRKGLGCHDALSNTQKRFSGIKWFIEFDIKGYFDNIDHQILVKLLTEKIDDERFITLIRWMLKAGYMEDWVYNKTYSGTPQGGVISPILANVYLHELDKFISGLYQRTHKGKERKLTHQYEQIKNERAIVRYTIKKLSLKELEQVPLHIGGGIRSRFIGWTKAELIEEDRKLLGKQLETRYYDPQDPNYRRIQYTRYADDFLLGYIGSKDEAIAIMEEIKTFLKETLNLECSEEKTRIAHHSKGVEFLGYHITTHDLKANANRVRSIEREGTKFNKRVWNNVAIKLFVPEHKVRSFILRKRYGNLNNWSDYQTQHKTELENNSDFEILTQFKNEARGFEIYYKLADNFTRGLSLFHYIAETSLVKTLAAKHKISVAKVYKTYKSDGNITAVNGKYKVAWFKLKQINRKTKVYGDEDIIYNSMQHYSTTEIVERLKAEECEYCSKTGGYFEVHHVRKMADIKEGKEKWEKLMIARNRKKIVLCVECHDLLHAGKLPDYRYKASA